MTSDEVMPTCKIARIVADGFRHRAQKRDDLMLDLGFDLANALHVEARFFANARDRRLGHFAESSQALGREDLHVEPFLKTIFLGPDAAHLRPRITRDHASMMPYERSNVQTIKVKQGLLQNLLFSTSNS